MTTSTSNRYDETNIQTMELVYGRGYMSAGGDEEVARIVGTVTITNKKILDIGCGLGGAVISLVRDHGAAHVHGIDIDDGLLNRAAQLVEAARVSERVTLTSTRPGPLPFDPASFDVVYVTATSCHVENLSVFFQQIHRVLNPGGRLIGGEWFKGENNTAYRTWDTLLRDRGLNFSFVDQPNFEQALRAGGFSTISIADRTLATMNLAEGYLRQVENKLYETLLSSLGEKGLASFMAWTRGRYQCFAEDGMRYGHFQAKKD